jgi:transposase, IS30 family
MRGYRQLSLEERCSIARLHEDGQSIRQIAAALDRQPSTIQRELKRNSGTSVGYRPGYAQQQAEARHWSGRRLEREDDLRDEVLARLAAGHSPEQVAGRMARENRAHVISPESIYRFIHAQLRRTNDYRWRLYLPRGKSRRGWRPKGGGSPIDLFPRRRSISQRPDAAADRRDPGHWEADFMLFAQYGQAILVAHERQSRALIIRRTVNRKADATAQTLAAILAPMPRLLRQTMTFDNGPEFARHHQLDDHLGVKTFFCDTHSPWQKGGVENAIGRLRRAIPRKTNLDIFSPDDVDRIAAQYNNTPRKCLGFKTPAEAFHEQLLHLVCESTPQPALA